MNNCQRTERKEATEIPVSSAETETFIEIKNKVLDDGRGSRCKFWKRRRDIIVLMTFLGECTKAILRSNLSIAVFPMTEKHTATNENGTIIYVQDFDWDVKTRGFLLSVFYYGYICTNLPGGILAIKYGGGRLYGVGIILTSVTTLITPVAARVHLYLLIAVRVFEGMSESVGSDVCLDLATMEQLATVQVQQGVMSASLELLLASWVPVNERSTSLALTMTGLFWGHIASVAASSAIGFHLGWDAIFYCTGSVGLVWFTAWLMLAKEHPELDKRISLSELTYIQKSTRSNALLKNKVSSIPYLKIVTSLPVWALLIADISCTWGYTLFLTLLPTYIKDVVKLDYQKSGYMSTLPFIITNLALYIISPVADLVTTKKLLTFTVARKIYISGCLVMVAAFAFLVQRATSVLMVMACLTGMTIFNGVCHAQVTVNALDLAPKYSSVLIGFRATIGCLCGILTPTISGFLTQNKTAEEWHTVFFIQAGICLLAALVYSVFASGELQPWAADTTHETSSPEQDVDHNDR